MNHTRKLQELGKALQTIKDFNDSTDQSEGVKARFNHYVAGLMDGPMTKEDISIICSEMNFSWIDQLGVFDSVRFK